MNTRNFEVLYTHQKLKKTKTWQDGCLKISSNGTKAVLFDDQGCSLEVFHIHLHKIFPGSDVECERYLISIGDEKITDGRIQENSSTRRNALSACGNSSRYVANTVPAARSDFESNLRKRKRDVHDAFRPNLPRPIQVNPGVLSQSSKHFNRTTSASTTQSSNHGFPKPNSMQNAEVDDCDPRGSRVKQSKQVTSLIVLGKNNFQPQKTYQETTQCPGPAQKRNRSQLLYLFGGKSQVVPHDKRQGCGESGMSCETMVFSTLDHDSNVSHKRISQGCHTKAKSNNFFCQAFDTSLDDEDDFSDASFQSLYNPKTNLNAPNKTSVQNDLPWQSNRSHVSSSDVLDNGLLTSCASNTTTRQNYLSSWQSDESRVSSCNVMDSSLLARGVPNTTTRPTCLSSWKSDESCNVLDKELLTSCPNTTTRQNCLSSWKSDESCNVLDKELLTSCSTTSRLNGLPWQYNQAHASSSDVLESELLTSGTPSTTTRQNYLSSRQSDESRVGDCNVMDNKLLTNCSPGTTSRLNGLPWQSNKSHLSSTDLLTNKYGDSLNDNFLLDYDDYIDDELVMFSTSDKEPIGRSSLITGRNVGNALDNQYIDPENDNVVLDYGCDDDELTMNDPSDKRPTGSSLVSANNTLSTFKTSFVSSRSLSSSRSVQFTSPLMSSLNNNRTSSSYQQDSRTSSVDLMISESSVGRQSFSGELYFPSNAECSGSITPTRQITIPTKFSSAIDYKGVLKSSLREHLNIIIFKLAQKYYGILSKADITSFSDTLSDQKENVKGPSCSHGPGKLRAVKKDGPNKGRHFYTCPGSGSNQCKFFQWADESHTSSSSGNKKISLTSSDSIRIFFKSKGVYFYHNCLLERRTQMPTKFYGKKYCRKDSSNMNSGKKSMYIVLKYRDSSSLYSKDDIWIISKSVNFEPRTTFVGKSLFYGPSSSGDLEIEPVSGYSPSNWKSGDTVHAIWVCNAGTELSCIQNLDDYVTLQQMPLLPYLLNGSQPTYSSQRHSFSAPLSCNIDRNSLGIAWPVIEQETEKMIALHNLNTDQAAALRSCAKVFISENEDRVGSLPITLIHGVFGAGKSFLLAVVVLLMVKLFEIADSSDEARTRFITWKILISSTTNVAVDRILLGLLDLGFDQFVRVGSVRKIAKPVLPFSIHSSGTDSQELKELQGMLKTELTNSEKAHVRKSIEMHKLGENRKVLLLDECSQMTEPTSLLPMARFGCRKLVLVGDPKQLNPTIQGSEPSHDSGLEQTLFDRLIKMDLKPILLRMQYRCHPVISSISNRLFYNDKLLDGVNAEDREPLVDFVPTLCFYNVSSGKEECSQDGSYFNSAEAKFVVVLIRSLLELDVEPKQIGVITQYKSQLTAITNSLTVDGAISHKEWAGIQISTVDAFQGGEKDIIILSCVRTKHIGFIDCKRRTNVALTRAKRHLCIVGCGKILSSNLLWGKIITLCRDSPEGFQSSETYIRQWKERQPKPVDNSESTGSSSKPKKSRKSRKTAEGKITPKPSSKTLAQETVNVGANVSTPKLSIPTKSMPSSDSDMRSELVEVQEIFDSDPTFDCEEINGENIYSDHETEITDNGDVFEVPSDHAKGSEIPGNGEALQMPNNDGACQISNNGGPFEISDPDDNAVKDQKDIQEEISVEKQTQDFENNFSDYMFDVDTLTDDELRDLDL